MQNARVEAAFSAGMMLENSLAIILDAAETPRVSHSTTPRTDRRAKYVLYMQVTVSSARIHSMCVSKSAMFHT